MTGESARRARGSTSHRSPPAVIFMLAAILAAILLGGCNKIEQKVVIHASPETIPAEIVDARWPDASIPVHYCLDPDGGYIDATEVLQLLQQAFSAWGVPAASDGVCRGPVATGNGRNEISWSQLSEPGAELSEAGKTSLRYRVPAGGRAEIIEADIQIDENTPKSRRNPECLYTTLLHETGHFLGLHHLPAGAVMAAVVTECAQELTPADRDALSQLY